ncbi:hypothetical protein Syun_021307 [Stephania yunnanensis]|uniref:Response regulatory domain-containing protein n=1 Tax=Stephania yunnanensis TaxID=152371 RepID=A0AAP0IG58_9MAGN
MAEAVARDRVRVSVKCTDRDRGLVMHRDKDRDDMLHVDRNFNWCSTPMISINSRPGTTEPYLRDDPSQSRFQSCMFSRSMTVKSSTHSWRNFSRTVIAKKSKVNMIIADHSMPEMTGYELLKNVKNSRSEEDEGIIDDKQLRIKSGDAPEEEAHRNYVCSVLSESHPSSNGTRKKNKSSDLSRNRTYDFMKWLAWREKVLPYHGQLGRNRVMVRLC